MKTKGKGRCEKKVTGVTNYFFSIAFLNSPCHETSKNAITENGEKPPVLKKQPQLPPPPPPNFFYEPRWIFFYFLKILFHVFELLLFY
jgi:hypothetical protein